MNPFLEMRRVRTICDELLQSLEFVYRTSFEASRVMEDEFIVAPENQFVLDVVHSTLACIDKDAPTCPSPLCSDTHPHGSLDLGQIDLVPFSIIDLRVFGTVTDRAENGRLASVRPPNDKDPEAAKFLSDVFETACLNVCLRVHICDSTYC